MMVVNSEGLVFAGQRIDTNMEAWQMPQGGIDDGEDPETAALRELEEEIGTCHVKILGRTKGWLTYDLPPELIGKVWKGKYRGQKQIWFAMRFLGDESEINIATAHPEFRTWKWIAVGDLPDLIVPFKRTLYEDVIDQLGHYIC